MGAASRTDLTVKDVCISKSKSPSKGSSSDNKISAEDVPEFGETGKTGTTIPTVKGVAGQLGSAILNSKYFSKCALWLSEILDKASKSAAELGNYKYRNTNSRKQK